MLDAIQSTKYPNYYKIPTFSPGMAPAQWRLGATRMWGRKATIDFLINLGCQWRFRSSEHSVNHTIYHGDISPEGGASAADPVGDHSTHKSGHDVDIFFVRQDGKSEKTSCLEQDVHTYGLEQNIKLGKLIVEVSVQLGLLIGFYYGNDKRVQKEVPTLHTHTNHEDHFHVNIVTKKEADAYRRSQAGRTKA